MEENMKNSETNLSRRGFLKSAGVAGVMAGAASVVGMPQVAEAKAAADESVYEAVLGDANSIYVRSADVPGPTGPIGFENRTIAKSEIKSTMNCDFLVVGAGISGITAALKGASLGADVIVLEKMSVGRGCFEAVGSVDSAIQKKRGIKTDRALLLDEIYRSANWRISPDVPRTYVNRSGEAIDFLQTQLDKGEKGFILTPLPMKPGPKNGMPVIDAELCFYETPGIPADIRFRSGNLGIYVVRDLTAVAKSYPNLKIHTDTPAVQLIRNKSGRVTGVIAKQGDRYIQVNASKGVLLSTGGYDANPDMLKAYVRPEDYASSSWWNPSWGTTGDGHMMGLKIGASMDPTPHPVMNFTFGHPESFHYPEVRTLRAMNLFIIVNDKGERIVREDVPFQALSNATNNQAIYGSKSWFIFDETMIGPNQAAVDKAEIGFEVLKKKGWLFEAKSPTALAKAMGMPSKTLDKTIKDFNAYKKANLDKDFNRDMSVVKPFTGKKYYAMICNSVILATTGGLIIDKDCRVLDTKGEVIEGLFASGNASGGFFSGNYPRHIPGTSIGRAITFGYLSALHAIKGV